MHLAVESVAFLKSDTSITTYWKYCISNAYHIVFGTVNARDT